MAPSVLGVGFPATGPFVPPHISQSPQQTLDRMESDMQNSPYEWEMFYFTPDMPFDIPIKKLRQKEWDIAMIGGKFFCAFSKVLNLIERL